MNSAARKPLDVRATPDQHRVLSEAAAREQRSISSFVLSAALKAAKLQEVHPRRSPDEVKAILSGFRAEVQRANRENRDVLADLLAERRAQAELE
jgi:hypothetical protein